MSNNIIAAHNNSNKPGVLFFGKDNCQYSQQAYEHLEHLGFDVSAVFSKSRKERLPEDIGWWRGDYIICFRSYFVLPKWLIDRARIAAINFHPAPTEYPGSGCLNWALYDGATQYGATAHIMNEKIDNGAIIECRRFPILPQDNVRTLLARAHHKTYEMLSDITTGLALEGEAFLSQRLAESQHEEWRGQARRMNEIDKLQVVNVLCDQDELNKVIRATYTPEFPPVIHLHGYKFVLKLDPSCLAPFPR
jgi:methionyl-tRNA formyltransferase